LLTRSVTAHFAASPSSNSARNVRIFRMRSSFSRYYKANRFA
jgi:hypothetical protein